MNVVPPIRNLRQLLLAPAFLLLVSALCTESGGSMPFAREREAMVQDQIIPRGIDDERLLEAMRSVPRHEFVPAAYRRLAYSDQPLPLSEGQTISQPYVVAYMTQQLQLEATERVLEVGTGSGYQAAILAHLCSEVFTIEIVPSLAQRAKADLERLGYANVQVREGDGYRGWPEQAPFDAIIVTAAPEFVPEPLIEQLAVGGRMILPVGDSHQRLVLIRKNEDGLDWDTLLPVRFVPMTGEAEAQTRDDN